MDDSGGGATDDPPATPANSGQHRAGPVRHLSRAPPPAAVLPHPATATSAPSDDSRKIAGQLPREGFSARPTGAGGGTCGVPGGNVDSSRPALVVADAESLRGLPPASEAGWRRRTRLRRPEVDEDTSLFAQAPVNEAAGFYQPPTCSANLKGVQPTARGVMSWRPTGSPCHWHKTPWQNRRSHDGTSGP